MVNKSSKSYNFKSMKRIFALVFGVMVAVAALAQSPVPATTPRTGPIITWETPTHDFGEMTQGDVVQYAYKFTNTGTEPLIITNVAVSCGCTTPKDWPRDPIAVNGKGEIVVAFNSTNKMSKQNKVITITSNAVNPEGTTVSFTADVIAKKVTPQ
jgi:hypothetical protein